jgi:hypothetical protein
MDPRPRTRMYISLLAAGPPTGLWVMAYDRFDLCAALAILLWFSDRADRRRFEAQERREINAMVFAAGLAGSAEDLAVVLHEVSPHSCRGEMSYKKSCLPPRLQKVTGDES